MTGKRFGIARRLGGLGGRFNDYPERAQIIPFCIGARASHDVHRSKHQRRRTACH